MGRSVVDVTMEWIQRNPKKAAGLSALAVLGVIALVWSMFGGASDSTSGPSSLPSLAVPTATPGRTLSVLPTPTTSATGMSLSEADGTAGSAGMLSLKGLPGGSMYKNLPRHHLVLRVTSDAPIGTVGYVIPTSFEKTSGVDKHVGTDWSLTTTVYGGPDYARIWVQAGPRGYPITCVITVDGKQTERRATDGPYGQLMCQG